MQVSCITPSFSCLETELRKKQTRVADLETKVKKLQSKVRYQTAKISKLGELLHVHELEEKQLIEGDTANLLAQSFSGTILDIFKHEQVSCSRSTYGRRYPEAIKQFALTLHYYSPQAYEYCKTITFPNVSSLRNYLSSSAEGPGLLS